MSTLLKIIAFQFILLHFQAGIISIALLPVIWFTRSVSGSVRLITTKYRREMKLILRTGLVVIALLMVPVLINVFDENLDPKVAALTLASVEPIPQKENSYFSLFGFQAPPGEDVHVRGIEMVADYDKSFKAEPGNSNILSPEVMLGEKRLRFVGKDQDLCSKATDSQGCLAYYLVRVDDSVRILNNNKLLLDRYFHLITYPHLQETLPSVLSCPIIPYAPVRKAHKLMLAKVALNINDGNVFEALCMLQRDTIYWRRVAVETNDLITKLVSFSLLKEDMRALSEIISMKTLTLADMVIANSIVKPLADQERSFSRPFLREAEWNKNWLYCFKNDTTLSWSERRFNRHFFKINATFNTIDKNIMEDITLDALKGPDYAAWQKDRRNAKSERKKHALKWDMLYNPAGKSQINLISTPYSNYISRGHNIDGLMRLVALKLLLKEAAVPDSQLEQFVRNAGPQYSDPYTDNPMEWDGSRRSLYFKDMDESGEMKERCEVYL